jgi:hypothetical protein
MPLFGVKGFENGRWEFETWVDVMKRLQRYLINNAQVLDKFKKTSLQKYRNDINVPFGQFFDLYYWTEDEKEGCCKNSLHEEETSTLLREDVQEEFISLINLLNNLKSKAKITAEEWRAYRKQWTEYPQSRSNLIEKLRHL